MIELFLNAIVGVLFLTIIWFLIQYGLKFRQERLRQEDYRNKIKQEEKLQYEQEQERLKRELQVKEQKQKEKEHQNKLANGYKHYEWKGYETWIYRFNHSGEEKYREKRLISGSGYFKSEEDLKNCLNGDWITLTWSREL